jgi:hypothetical protein
MPSVFPTDIVVHRPNGSFVAAIEVKNREDLTADVAARLRRNLVAHNVVPTDVPYFVLVSQDRGFLWKDTPAADWEARPTAEFSMEEVVRRFGPPGLRGRLRGSELESVVFAWLGALAELAAQPNTEPEATLSRLGFVDGVRGGTITREVA